MSGQDYVIPVVTSVGTKRKDASILRNSIHHFLSENAYTQYPQCIALLFTQVRPRPLRSARTQQHQLMPTHCPLHHVQSPARVQTAVPVTGHEFDKCQIYFSSDNDSLTVRWCDVHVSLWDDEEQG